MTLSSIKAFYNEESCFETETGFLVNRFGKYRPNITFIVPKTYDLNKNGKPIDPLSYIEDREVTANMNLDFDGSASFIFGDFWRSKKGGACFRPKNPMQAKHLLIRVDWGGAFDRHRGNYPEDVKDIDGVLYFRRASSNGGGSGYDYWVLPVGYTRLIHDVEIDGDNTKVGYTSFEQRAKTYRKKYADLQKKAVEEADTYLKEKAASEKASIHRRDDFMPRLTEIQAELAELDKPQKFGNYGVGSLTLGEAYFKLGYDQYLYSEEGLAKAESYLVRMRDWVTGEEAKRRAKADAKEIFVPKYEELRDQIERIGWELSFGEEGALVKNPAKVCNTYYCRDNGITTYPYNLDGVENLRESVEKEADRIAEEDMRARNAERIRSLLADTDLPEELWFLFEGSEDLDSTIRKEVEAILAAVTVEKDDMDLHELNYCGFDRRVNAIYRVLGYVGGGKMKLNIGGQSGSRQLANFITGD